VCVCVCVCVSQRERVCVCERERVREDRSIYLFPEHAHAHTHTLSLSFSLSFSFSHKRCVFHIFRLIVYIFSSPSTLRPVVLSCVWYFFSASSFIIVFMFSQFFGFFGLPNTVSLRSQYCAWGRAIKRPRTRSTAARQMSNAHERDLVTNQNV